jgi:peroxiredoxin
LEKPSDQGRVAEPAGATLYLLPGDEAPDFELLNQDRELVRLATELDKGPVILAFFPAAFSRVCTKEMCTFRDWFKVLESYSARLFGISVDTFFSLKAWASEQHLQFSLLSDFNKEVIARYGVWNDNLYGMKGVAKRAIFLIDRQRIIRFREVLDDPAQEPHYENLKSAINKFCSK